MAGLLSYSVAGLGFLLIAAIEALIPFRSPLTLTLNLPLIRYLSIATLSSLFILHSLVSSLLYSSSGDPLGLSLPFSAAAASAPFLLYSLAGFLLPALLAPILPLLSLFSFFNELLFFHLRRKDIDGIENRYFDLLLVPILVCLLSTLASLAWPRSAAPRVARAAGLALHGTWLLQMGFSFFSSAIVHGCFLHRRSWANYTIKCKGHPDYHRGRAIATLQFNCHLALLVVVAVGVYSAAVSLGEARGGEGYKALNKELQRMGNGELSRFSLEDDEENEEQEIENGEVAVRVMETKTRNGFGGAH